MGPGDEGFLGVHDPEKVTEPSEGICLSLVAGNSMDVVHGGTEEEVMLNSHVAVSVKMKGINQ